MAEAIRTLAIRGAPLIGVAAAYGLALGLQREGNQSLDGACDDLPAFVVIPDARESPPGGAINWSNGFLPARHQGVVLRSKGPPVDDLFPAAFSESSNPLPADAIVS